MIEAAVILGNPHASHCRSADAIDAHCQLRAATNNDIKISRTLANRCPSAWSVTDAGWRLLSYGSREAPSQRLSKLVCTVDVKALLASWAPTAVITIYTTFTCDTCHARYMNPHHLAVTTLAMSRNVRSTPRFLLLLWSALCFTLKERYCQSMGAASAARDLTGVNVLCRSQISVVRMVAGLAFGLAAIQGRTCGAILSVVRRPACIVPVHRMLNHVPASASADLC